MSSYKVLAQTNPSATTLTDSYTVPGGSDAVISSIFACNRSSTPTTVRVSVAVAGAGDDNKQYIAYDLPLAGNDSIPICAGITVGTTDVIRVYAHDATVTFSIFGEEGA